MMYYCGWDGGATKTCVCITDENGNAIYEKAFGPININGASIDTVRNTIRDCVDFMNTLPEGMDAYRGLVVGIAGISNLKSQELITEAIREYGYQGSLCIKGDQEIALAGAIDGHGAILIAGTGSICFLRDERGNTLRCGGYGYLIDDEGSGYAIGRDILTAVVRSADGRGPKTLLAKAAADHLKINDIPSLITYIYSPEVDKRKIASLAPLLLPAIHHGDEVAERISKKASESLAELVISVFRRADLTTGEVALAGSILTHFKPIRAHVEEILKQKLPQVKIISPRRTPAQGAAQIAKEMF